APFLSTMAQIWLHRDHGPRPAVIHWRGPAAGRAERDHEPVRRLELETPGLGKYGKLSDARNGSPNAGVHDLSGAPGGAEAQVRQLKTRPLSSVGRASPW